MDAPLVSVLLPAYNAQNTILESIDSILNQTYQNFELIIINDGSTDATAQMIQSTSDKRIRYYENDGNKGLIYTLNRGISLSEGTYIARMDADDISLPTRIEKQVALMERAPNVIVCGTNISFFGSQAKLKKASTSFLCFSSPSEFKCFLIKGPGLAHPTVMIRKSVLDENKVFYNDDFLFAEDYKLWIDLSSYGDFYNIKEKLLEYRLSETQISQPYNLKQIENTKRCRWEYLERSLNRDTFQLLKKDISIKTIGRVRKKIDNVQILEVLYLSLSKYTFATLFYYIFSGDAFLLGRSAFIRFMKRLILGTDSYL